MVIDGKYSPSLPQQLERATGVILLNTSTVPSLFRYLSRSWLDRDRVGGLEGAPDQVNWVMIRHITISARFDWQNQRMDTLFRFPAASRHDPEVQAWFAHADALRGLVQPWFERLHTCGPDVRELIHDGRPTACADDAAFAYVDVYTGHANIGFFFGAFLNDPAGLLQGAGKRMRHVKLQTSRMPDEAALGELVIAPYRDIHRRRGGTRPLEWQ